MFKRILLPVLLLSLLLTSCGIRGSLYLPPDAVKNSYFGRLKQEFNDWTGFDTIGSAPEDDNTVIEVADPKNFTIDGRPLEQQEGSEMLPTEEAEESEESDAEAMGVEAQQELGGSDWTSSTEIAPEAAYLPEVTTAPPQMPEESSEMMPSEENSAVMHELPVRGQTSPKTSSSGTE